MTKYGLGLLLVLLAAGCSSADNNNNNNVPDSGTVEPPGECVDPTSVMLTDENNYSLANQFDIQRSVLKDATDLEFDWSKVTVDFFGKSMDPAEDIDTVLISLWSLTPDEIEDALKTDNLALTSNVGAITSYPDGSYTSTKLLDFNLLGNPLPLEQLWSYFDTSSPDFHYPQDQFTFMLMASTGRVLGQGARMLSFFTLDPDSSQTKLEVTNDSTKLDVDVDIAKAKPIYVPAGESSITVGWSKMTTNSLGNEFIYSNITEAAVAHFPTSSVAELEKEFKILDDIADKWYSGPVVSGRTIDLGTLKDEGDNSFPGIDDNGTWLVALFCSENCNNPAPWTLTVLRPCAE